MTPNATTERQEIEQLLPWHAAGTLNRRDAKRVEDALAHDPELARHFELARAEFGETILLNETLGAPSARASEALFAKIDAEPRRVAMPSLNLSERFAAFIAGFSPRTLAWSAAAAMLALVLQAGVITGVLINEQGRGGYKTASAPTNVPADGSFAMIRFMPTATTADITKFLETNKLSVTGGPQAGGMFRIRLAVTGLPKQELARIVRQLQQDKVVEIIATVE
jgi:anti-sigma factor RsiW